MRSLWTVTGAALLIVLAYLLLSVFVDGYGGGNIFPDGVAPDSWAAPNSWPNWRDIVIVFVGILFVFAGLLTIVLLIVLILLIRTIRDLLRESVAPAVDSLKGTLDNIRGTTEFAGETVVSPLIRVYSVVKGVRTGVSAVGGLPGRIRGRKKKSRWKK